MAYKGMFNPLHQFGQGLNRGLGLDDRCLLYLELTESGWAPQPWVPQCALEELERIGGFAALVGIAQGKIVLFQAAAGRPASLAKDGSEA